MGRDSVGILTEVGTNELEVVEFLVDDRPYAINVAKVREIIRLQPVMTLPESHPHVLGVFRNRDEVLPLVDLGRWLNVSTEADPTKAKVIVTEFNAVKVGFLVHAVNRIHRISWGDLEAPEAGSMLDTQTTLGYIRLGGDEGQRIVFMIDFEGIVASLRKSTDGVIAASDDLADRRRGKTILVAEDSNLIRKVMKQRLEGGGFSVTETTNGQEAWQKLEDGPLVDLIISDIEMPRMDGHHLTKRIKEDPRFQKIPVILYSSMIYEESRRKGEAVGADAQICKPDLERLVETVDGLIACA